MKLLIFAHRLEIGGTQTNAIELAAALRDIYGFQVVIFATPGPLLRFVNDKSLSFVPAPDAYLHPSWSRMQALRRLVQAERPDLIQVWDWWQCVDAYYSVHLAMRVPMIVSDMMMTLTRVLPKGLPTTFGTPEIADRARAAGWQRAEFIPPPVDVHRNAPGVVDPRPFRESYGLRERDLVFVSVSRLAKGWKSESLFRMVEVVAALGGDLPLRFVIVGDGEVRTALTSLANEVNRSLGRPAVVLTGALIDPRPAYAAADVVVGMGGSALRGMAFAKPVLIVGEQGFSRPLTPETANDFYYKGIYGRGDGDPANAGLLADIRWLTEDAERLLALGILSREFVVRHFSLETVSGQLATLCRTAVGTMPRFGRAAIDGVRTAAVYLRERDFLIPSRDRLKNLLWERAVQ